ncbi:MAG: 5'-deoxynucleotidase [Clostridia bacterium]|nr:5'-deoxynucleotidase [Clostridia bacterium]MBQ1965582.1 5'-deoxynucleotidase [Clostridia bacterium]
MFHFFAFIDRMRYIHRWGLMRSTIPETLTEHAQQVAMIAHALVLIENRKFGADLNPDRAAVLALYHDASETITGDLPTPIKYYNREILGSYRAVEDYAKDTLLDKLPDYLQEDYSEILNGELEPEWAFVKAADTLSAYLKCVTERQAGNREFLSAEQSLWTKLQTIPLNSLRVFEEEFLDGYGKTLDEMAEETL